MANGKLKPTIFLLIISLFLALPSSLNATPAAKRARLSQLKNQVDSIDQQIEVVDEQYLQSKLKLKKTRNKIYLNTQQLNSTQAKLNKFRKLLSGRVRAMYKQNTSSSLEFLLVTKSFNELITNLDFIDRVSQNDSSIVKKVSFLKKQIENTRGQLKANLGNQKVLVKTLGRKKTAIETEISRKRRLIRGLESDLKAYEEAQERQALEIAAQEESAADPVSLAPEPLEPPTTAAKSEVVQIAMKYLGRPYKWGAAGPYAFDCSGFTMFVYRQVGVSLPHSSAAQFNIGQPVPRSALQPGDLIFRGNPGIHHVGIYVGGGQMINAPRTGDVVKISPAFTSHYAGARRP